MSTYQLRWRHALTISLLVHIFLLALTGLLAIQLFTIPPVTEQVVELDLASQQPALSPAESTAVPQSAPVPSLQPSLPAHTALPANPIPVVTSATALSDVTAEPVSAYGTNTGSDAGSTSAGSAAADGSGNSGSTRGSILPPRILAKTEPDYPAAARQASRQGTAVLKVQILENGLPGTITLLQSSGHEELDSAAAAAVRRWRFVPAKDSVSGRTIVCYSTLPVSFRLN
jgi:protein TonB